MTRSQLQNIFVGIVLLAGMPLSAAELPVKSVSAKSVPGFTVLGNLGLLPASAPTVSYGGWITPEQVPGDVVQHRLTVQVPVDQGGGSSLSLSAGGTSLHFGEEQALSGSGIAVPVDLWKAELGGSYSRIENDKLIGGRISVGSASDHPFSDLGVTTLGASAFYSWASTERSRWMLTVFFSNNNPIINYIPIPGFIYLYHAPTLIGMFGLPFSSVIWMPEGSWRLTLSVFGPTINAEIADGDPGRIQFFTGFSWLQQSYLRENRPDPKDRLYYSEMHAPLGVRFPVARALKSELSAGYAFNRSVYEGVHFDSKEDGSASLGNSWYGAWNLSLGL